MIICITGLPGSGKTTIAEILKEKVSPFSKVVHLTTDDVRNKLYFAESQKESEFFKRDFSDDELARSYNGLYLVIENLLERAPETVIITDGTYRQSKQRIMLELIAERQNLPFHLMYVEVDEKTRQSRGKARMANGGHSYNFEGTYEQPSEAIRITNSGDIEGLSAQIELLVNNLCNPDTT